MFLTKKIHYHNLTQQLTADFKINKAKKFEWLLKETKSTPYEFKLFLDTGNKQYQIISTDKLGDEKEYLSRFSLDQIKEITSIIENENNQKKFHFIISPINDNNLSIYNDIYLSKNLPIKTKQDFLVHFYSSTKMIVKIIKNAEKHLKKIKYNFLLLLNNEKINNLVLFYYYLII